MLNILYIMQITRDYGIWYCVDWFWGGKKSQFIQIAPRIESRIIHNICNWDEL